MTTKAAPRPSTPRPSTPHADTQESLITRTILAPILFISFIVSLLIIDRRTAPSILSPRASPPGSPNTRSETKQEKSYYHSHQRKLARRSLDEAFAIRGQVIAWMGVVAAVGFLGIAWLGWKVWSWVKNV